MLDRHFVAGSPWFCFQIRIEGYVTLSYVEKGTTDMEKDRVDMEKGRADMEKGRADVEKSRVNVEKDRALELWNLNVFKCSNCNISAS